MSTLTSRFFLAAALLMPGLAATPALAAEAAMVLPPPAQDAPKPAVAGTTETAVFAGGCFWGVQAVYQHVNGVKGALSGYAGGSKDSADYHAVSSGRTEHAEAVEITFDPSVVSYGTLLQVYFSVAHDPTTLNRQGPDVGPQYRSAIFAADDAQRRVAEAYIAQLGKASAFPRAIVTQINPAMPFYRAEAYHQDYATLHPTEPYIAYNDLPKVENLKKLFPALWRDKPALVGVARPQS